MFKGQYWCGTGTWIFNLEATRFSAQFENADVFQLLLALLFLVVSYGIFLLQCNFRLKNI